MLRLDRGFLCISAKLKDAKVRIMRMMRKSTRSIGNRVIVVTFGEWNGVSFKFHFFGRAVKYIETRKNLTIIVGAELWIFYVFSRVTRNLRIFLHFQIYHECVKVYDNYRFYLVWKIMVKWLGVSLKLTGWFSYLISRRSSRRNKTR